MSTLQSGFTTAFQEAQLSFAKHKKAAALLHKLKASAGAQAFEDEFFACLACVLQVYKREPAAERIVEFVVQFATSAAEDQPYDEAFMQSLCIRLLALSHAKEKAVRFRVAQLVGRMMNSMAEDAEVSDELFEAVEEAMITRCRDKVPLVRAWALRALFRLQNPLDAGDEITRELLRLMALDGSKEVRMAAISTVAPSKHAIRAILGRTRDVCEEVRLHALSVLSSKVEMRWLSISQRNALLHDALRDRQPKVREACAQLLVGSWLRKADNEPRQLLKCLDVCNNEEAALLAVQAMLRDPQAAPLVAAVAAGWASLEPEALLCLRAQLQHLADAGGEAGLDGARPELGAYCDALGRAVAAGDAAAGDAARDREAFALAQLLRASAHLDMADEHGRARLEALVGELLKAPGTSDELLPQLMRALASACAGETERYQRLVLELVAEVEDPLEGAAEGRTRAEAAEAEAQLQREEEAMLAEARLCELRAEVHAAVEEEDFDRASALKQQAEALQARLAELRAPSALPEHERLQRASRCLQLVELLLQEPTLRLREMELAHLPERLVPALQSHQPELRALALRCVSLYCHASVAAARRFWPLLLKALQHDVPPVQLAALRSVVDLLLLHGAAQLCAAPPAAPPAAPRAAPAAPSEDAHAAEIAQLLLPLLEQPTGPLRSAAAVGLAKLLHSGRVASSALLARLLLVYFQPADAGGATDAADAGGAAALQQHLAVFFAASGGEKRVAAALLPAVRAALAAPPGSADAGVGVDAMVQFVLALCRQEGEAAGGAPAAGALHEELGLALCCEMLVAAEDKEGRALPKALAHLHLHAGGARLPLLARLAARLAAATSDKTALRHVQRLQERLALLLGAADADAHAGAADATAAAAEAVAAAAEEMLAAHRAVRDADGESAEGRERERRRGEEAAEDEAQRVLTPSKAKPRRKLTKAAKATPSRFAGVENDVTVA